VAPVLAAIPPPMTAPTEQAEHRAERDRTRAFFDRTAFAFRVIERVVLPEYRDTLARLRLPLSFTVVDFGTGTGSLARAFWERGHRVVGVDFSESLLRRARKLSPGVRFDLRDIVDLETLPDGAFDVVAMGYVLHGMPPTLRARALRLAGRIAAHHVLVIDHGQHGGWFTRLIEWVEGPHYAEYTRRPLRETLESCGLEIVEQDRTRSGGRSWLCRRKKFIPE
jgi:SAM-dependent methyltransferase